jgi:hypothetical protein
MSRTTELQERAERAAVDAGATAVAFEAGMTHIRMRIRVGRREGVYFLSKTPGDVRTFLNARAGIRRLVRALTHSSEQKYTPFK